jgi:hypothetical protein
MNVQSLMMCAPAETHRFFVRMNASVRAMRADPMMRKACAQFQS